MGSSETTVDKMTSIPWLGQTLASLCWIVSVFVYKDMQMAMDCKWTMAIGVTIGSSILLVSRCRRDICSTLLPYYLMMGNKS